MATMWRFRFVYVCVNVLSRRFVYHCHAAGFQPRRPCNPAASESRVYQSRRVADVATASGATLPRAGPAAPLRRAGGGIARFAASTTSGQRTVWHACIGFSQADLMRSQPSGGRRMAATHLVGRRSRRRRARAAIHCLRHPGLYLSVYGVYGKNSWRTQRTDRRDEGRSPAHQCEDELHRFRAVLTFVAEHPKASCGVALSRRFRCVRLLQWSVEP